MTKIKIITLALWYVLVDVIFNIFTKFIPRWYSVIHLAYVCNYFQPAFLRI